MIPGNGKVGRRERGLDGDGVRALIMHREEEGKSVRAKGCPSGERRLRRMKG